MSRELVILCADGTMRAVLGAFFARQFHHALGCAPFDFDVARDIYNNPLEKDGGVHRRSHEILRPFVTTHRRALVVLDQQFGGERPAAEVRGDIERLLDSNGWQDRRAVAVIGPELEVLLWQNNPNVEAALRYVGPPSLRQRLEDEGRWPSDQPKPPNPKELILDMIKRQRAGPPAVVYSQIVSRVATHGCIDPAFQAIRDALRAWFPAEGA